MNNDGHDAGKSETATADAHAHSKHEERLNFRTLLERFYMGRASAESNYEQNRLRSGSAGKEKE